MRHKALIEETIWGIKIENEYVEGTLFIDEDSFEDSYIKDDRGVEWKIDMDTLTEVLS